MTQKILAAAILTLTFLLPLTSPHPVNAQATTFESRANILLTFAAGQTGSYSVPEITANYALARYALNQNVATANTMMTGMADWMIANPSVYDGGSGRFFDLYPVMVGLLRYQSLMSQTLRDKIRAAAIEYDPVYDMCGTVSPCNGDTRGGTQNHRTIKMIVGYLVAQTYPTAPRMANQLTFSKSWLERNLYRWATMGISEQDSSTYQSLYFHLTSLIEFANDANIRDLARLTTDRMLASMAPEWIDGYQIAVSNRDNHGMMSPQLSYPTGITAWLYFGGDQPVFTRRLSQPWHSVMPAIATYRVPSIIERIAQQSGTYVHRERRAPLPESSSLPTNNVSYITPTYGVASSFMHTGGSGGVQDRRWLVRWISTGNPVSTFYLSNDNYGEAWTAPITTPYEQALQRNGTLVTVFNVPSTAPSYIEGPFSLGMSSTIQDPSGWLFAHTGNMLMGVRTAGTLAFVADRSPFPTYEQDIISRWLQSTGRKNAVIVETSPVGPYAGGGAAAELQRFADDVKTRTVVDFSQVTATSPRARFTNLAGDVLDITYDGAKTINGATRIGDNTQPTLSNQWMYQAHGSNILTITEGGEEWVWDFNALTVTQTGTADTTPPTTPTNPAASAVSNNQINLTWTASTDNVGVTGYSVERCTGAACSNFSAIATPTGTSFNDTGLTSETLYRYRIRASDAAANFSGYSAIVEAITQATTGGGVNNPIVWWPFEENTGTTTYDSVSNRLATLSNGPTWTTGRIGNAILFDGVNDYLGVADAPALDPGTGSFTVAAWVYTGGSVNTYGQGILAKETNTGADRYFMSILPSGQLGALFRVDGTTAFEASFGGAVLPLNTWRHVAVTFDRNGVATGYVNGVAEPTTRSIASLSGLTFDSTNIVTVGSRSQGSVGFFTGRIDDVRYYNSVLSPGDIQILANPAPLPDTIAPTVPGNLTATPSSETEIALLWTASTDDVGVTGYRLERCTGASCTNFVEIATPSGTSHNDTGLTTNTPYRYRVRAVDAAGNLSGYSTIAQATTLGDTAAPSIPTNLTATTVSATQINLSWSASTDNIGVTGYHLERCTGAACVTFTEVATPAATAHIDSFLTEATTYRYRVRASDATGNLSGYSAIAQDTTQTVPIPPPPVPNAPIAQWRMDELGGIYTADNVGGRTATLLNGPTWTAGRIGSAIFFDGINDHLALSDSASATLNPSGDFTITAWVYPDPTKGGTIVAKESAGSSDRFYISLSASRILQAAFVVDGVTAFAANFGGSAITPNAWSHIAVSFNRNGNAIGYVNGIAQPTSRPINTLGSLTFSNSDLFTIGAGGQGTTDFFLGRIDDVRMFAAELPVTDILAIYTETVLCE